MLNLKQNHFSTILADPPWKFKSCIPGRNNKEIPHYPVMKLKDIIELPVKNLSSEQAHLYLWVPNALIAEGLQVMKEWGFTYKTNIIWHKILKDGRPDSRGLGYYFRNTTEIILFGTKGKNPKTFSNTQINYIATQKKDHSRKPHELYSIIEECSPGPYLELFARKVQRPNWITWGNEA